MENIFYCLNDGAWQFRTAKCRTPPKTNYRGTLFKKKTLFIQPPQVNIIYDYILSTQMYKTICKSIILKTPLIQPPHCYIL